MFKKMLVLFALGLPVAINVAIAADKKKEEPIEHLSDEQIYEELKRRDNEWIRSFIELLRQYEEATPEHKEMVLEMLRRSKG